MSAAFNPFERHVSKPEPAQAQPDAETTVEQPADSKPPVGLDLQNQRTPLNDQSGSATPTPPSSAARTGKAVNPFASYAVTPKAHLEPERARRLPAQDLLVWIQRGWRRPTISLRDICTYGPPAIRKREAAATHAETLEKHGWLVEIQAHRHDRRLWRTPPAGATALPD
jgi:hypothetical protein